MRLTRRSFLDAVGSSAVAAALCDKGAGLVEFAESGKLASDPLRPQYHLLPAANWMNDPNGPIYWDGNYHVFHQYNPDGPYWGNMHWAHAVSPDMVHWRHLPVVLAPTAGSADRDGCFSGSAVLDRGVPTILYTGVASTSPETATLRDGTHNFRESQCLATSDDPELRTWKKLPQPVLAAPPAGLSVTGFRDPCLWSEGDFWYLAIGSGFPKQGGAVLLYRSHDLRKWEYLHPLLTGKWSGRPAVNPVDSGEMWECPDFFALGSKHVLLYSTEGKVYWLIGSYDRKELQFHPERRGLLDSGAYYAPKSMLDRDGNRILWGWIPEARPTEEYVKAGWAGVMALPRILQIGPSGDLEMRAIPNLQTLRGSPQANTDTLSFDNFSAELQVSFALSEKTFSITFGPQSIPYLSLRYEPTKRALVVQDRVMALAEPVGHAVDLRIFMDGSVLEIFVNHRQAHTLRVYNLKKDLARTDVRIEGRPLQLQLWNLRAISADRLST